MAAAGPSDVPDCLSCGLCCVALHDQAAYCNITKAETKRLGAWGKKNVLLSQPADRFAYMFNGSGEPPYGAIKTEWTMQKAGPLKGCETCSCVALVGSVLNKVRCSIYEKRPQTCREAVVPGDRTCLNLRRMVDEAIKKTEATAATTSSSRPRRVD